ncbi:MAG TPA: DUF2059 domain-containing protein [Geothermobacteraceae bacterium]|nr:DUF2059 domain-containing protein [Geothermobacteraceae bacterium]
MRFTPILILIVLLAACCPKPSPVPTTDEALNREAELMVRASLTDRLMENAVKYYRTQAALLLTKQGLSQEEAEAKIMEVVQPLVEAEHQRLVEALVPIYRRHYTAAEIHQLLSFYQTEVAKKSTRVSTRIAADGQEFVSSWNEHLGEAFMKQVVDSYGIAKP